MNKKALTFILVLVLAALALGSWKFFFTSAGTVITEPVPVAVTLPDAQDITEKP